MSRPILLQTPVREDTTMTFQDLNEQYLDRRLRYKASYRKFRQIHAQFFAGWTEHPTRRQIADLHQSLASTPAHANKALTYLKAMYGWAIDQDLWTQDNPATRVKRHPTYGRERTLSQREATRLMEHLPWMAPKFRLLMTIMLTTGCRLSEGLQMEWTHIDLDACAWLKPTTKNGRSQRIPLPTQTRDALRSWHHSGRYVLMGMYDHHWSRTAAEKTWNQTRTELSMSDVCLHDIRRTVSNRLRRQGVHPFVVNKILNHYTQDITERHYNTVDFDEQADALQRHADELWALRTKEVHHVDPTTAAIPVDGMGRIDRPALLSASATDTRPDHGHPAGPGDHELLG